MSQIVNLTSRAQLLEELTAIESMDAQSQLVDILERIATVRVSSLHESTQSFSATSPCTLLQEGFQERTEQIYQRCLRSLESINSHDLRHLFIYTAENNHLHALEALLSQRTLAQDTLGAAVVGAVRNGHLSSAQILLSDGRSISPASIGMAVEVAARNNRLSILQFLLSNATAPTQEHLDYAAYAAARNGHLICLQALLSDGRMIGQNSLNRVAEAAADMNHLPTVQFLLTLGAILSFNTRCTVIIASSEHAHLALLERLLQAGPIDQFTRDSALRAASSGQDQRLIRNMLRMARTLTQESTSFDTQLPKQTLSLTFADVKNNPELYLKKISKKFPSSIYLEDQPETIDLGGVTKDFISSLFVALVTKKILTLSTHQLPMISQKKPESKKLYMNLGKALSHLDAKNSERSDLILIGNIFNSKFFQILKLVDSLKRKKISESQFLIASAKIIKEHDPNLSMSMDIIINPSDATFSAYNTCMGEEGDPTNTVKEELSQYLLPAEYLYEGASDSLKTKIEQMTGAALCESFQGKEATKEDLIKALTLENPTPLLRKQKEWIKEAIAESDLTWRKAFLKTITGRETFLSGTKILLRTGWRGDFEAHTCFNSLDLPQYDLSDKDRFLEAFKIVVQSSGYNIA